MVIGGGQPIRVSRIKRKRELAQTRKSFESDTYRQSIESVLSEYTHIPYAYGDVQTEVIFDRERDRYLLVAEVIGAALKVHSRPGSGTRIWCSLER
jgi:hypothetical protein